MENHLTAFGTNFTAAYRGDGLRAWHEDAWGRTYYLYDGWRPVQQLDGDGNVGYTLTFGANGLVAYGNSLSLYDWQGNTLEYWEQDGTPGVWEALPAYGAAYEWQHGYGRGGTELVFCTFRYLDPSRGRWVTRDPIGYEGGVNLSAYLGNTVTGGHDAIGLLLYIGTVLEEQAYWQHYPHYHRPSTPPFKPGGGDKFVHCCAACSITLRSNLAVGLYCARTTERYIRFPWIGKRPGPGWIDPGVGDPYDEEANMRGVKCATAMALLYLMGNWAPSRWRKPSVSDIRTACEGCCKRYGYDPWDGSPAH